MANTESITPTLLYYIDYAARVREHFETFYCPFYVSARDIPPCECGSRGVWHCFPFASVPILDAAERAVAYTACLRERALHGTVRFLSTGPAIKAIPFSFVLAVLQTMLDDPNHPTYHHTGQIRGYCSRNGYAIEPYNCRFGRGYRVHYPSAKASPGRHKVEYYINTKEAQS